MNATLPPMDLPRVAYRRPRWEVAAVAGALGLAIGLLVAAIVMKGCS
ncbi:MAG TPA: hypothetical protein VNQ99_17815 [Xanthobacteraceae bacterium]|nr:hypothetical protein [Xanthobacteraceae bacterium]